MHVRRRAAQVSRLSRLEAAAVKQDSARTSAIDEIERRAGAAKGLGSGHESRFLSSPPAPTPPNTFPTIQPPSRIHAFDMNSTAHVQSMMNLGL